MQKPFEVGSFDFFFGRGGLGDCGGPVWGADVLVVIMIVPHCASDIDSDLDLDLGEISSLRDVSLTRTPPTPSKRVR